MKKSKIKQLKSMLKRMMDRMDKPQSEMLKRIIDCPNETIAKMIRGEIWTCPRLG